MINSSDSLLEERLYYVSWFISLSWLRVCHFRVSQIFFITKLKLILKQFVPTFSITLVLLFKRTPPCKCISRKEHPPLTVQHTSSQLIDKVPKSANLVSTKYKQFIKIIAVIHFEVAKLEAAQGSECVCAVDRT